MNVTGIVFTNDASLGELTTKRTMASLPFGGPPQLPVPDEPHRRR